MINTKEEAGQVALHWLTTPIDVPSMVGDEYVLPDDKIIEKDYGWVFRVYTRKYLETRSREFSNKGMSGVVVEKRDGSVYPLGSLYSFRTYIKMYEADRNPSFLRKLVAYLYLAFDEFIGKVGD